MRTLGQAVAGFPEAGRLQLRQAGWRGERLFWAGEPQQLAAFAAAVAYARRRGLEVVQPAELTRYRLSESGLAGLRRRYHVLAMPAQAWSDPAFMGLLLDQGMPYARLALLRRSAPRVPPAAPPPSGGQRPRRRALPGRRAGRDRLSRRAAAGRGQRARLSPPATAPRRCS
ncbi:hypothetical protein ACFSHR_06865 [Azotobacter chroococcum]